VSTPFLLLTILALGVAGWFVGNWRARASVGGKTATLHSRPGYYGAYVLLWTALPALFLVVVWSAIAPLATTSMVEQRLPETVRGGSEQAVTLTMSTVRLIEKGLDALSPDELEKAVAPGADVKTILQSKGVP